MPGKVQGVSRMQLNELSLTVKRRNSKLESKRVQSEA